MADDGAPAGGRRGPKRRCTARARAGAALPSAIHYVGYVEDDETPEMIMAKFQELERIEKAAAEARRAAEAGAAVGGADAGGAGAAGDAGEGGVLDDEHLLEVFKQTSLFNVKSALQDNALLLDADDGYGDDDLLVSDDDGGLRAFWSDEGEEGPQTRAKEWRCCGGHTCVLDSVILTLPSPVQRTIALVRRKARATEPDEIVQYRMPPAPIPLAWGRTSMQADPARRADLENSSCNTLTPSPSSTVYREVPSIVSADLQQLAAAAPGGGYQAVLVNSGWEAEGRGDDATQILAKVPLDKLTPVGFAFVWVQKQHVQALCRLMKRWGFVYIENLTWVFLGPNNTILRLPGSYLNSSHLTLYMFRKAAGGKDIELRHQRNPDVTVDCLCREPETARRAYPRETFVAIETLLPTCKGRFLELWAPRGVRRPGWTHLAEVGTS
eukprot:scaffold14.g1347.t1